MKPIVAAQIRNPPPELGVGSVLSWHEAVTELNLVFAQLLNSYTPIGCHTSPGPACPPVESNTLELSNALLCHGTWLSFLVKHVVAALIQNPVPELGVASVLFRYEAVTELCLVIAQLLESYAPNACLCPPFKPNILELSDTLLCYATGIFCVVQPTFAALIRNPPPELGVVSVLLWHEAGAQ